MTERLSRFESVAFVAIAFVTLAFAGGCSNGSGPGRGRGCTLIGCQNGLEVAFSRPLRETGSYTVTLVLDGQSVTCQTALPIASCSAGGGCSSPDVLLEQSGCALPASNHEIIGLRVMPVAKAVQIRIERDDSEIANDEFAPSYVRSQPNGEGCGPICEQASATLDVL